MPIIDNGALKMAVDLARPVIAQSLSTAGQAVTIPQQLSDQLNAALSNAVLEELLTLRDKERSVSLETLRLTVR